MRGATWTRKLRSAATSGAILAGAGVATALGWSGWVETETVTGATNAQSPAVPAAGTLTARPARSQAAVLVCQATGDGGYVLVRVLSGRLAEYRSNPNNLVPAPAGGCPASVGSGEGSIPTTAAPPAQPPATTSTPATASPTPPATTTATTSQTPPKTPSSTRAPTRRATHSGALSTSPRRSASIASSGASPSGAVAPATARGGSAPRRIKTYTGKLPANLKRLPNTGNETALLLFFGADLLLLGAGLRLRSRRFAI